MKFVIFHGSYGSSEGNWFPYLKNQLELLGQEVLIKQFPVEDYDLITKLGEKKAVAKKQNLKNWLEYFEKNIYKEIIKSKRVVFIGHSSAPVFILHEVDKFNIKLDSAIFVSPFLRNESKLWQYQLVNKSFFKSDFDFSKLKKLIPISYSIYGDNDPYVSKELLIEFGVKMGSQFIEVKGGGHLNAEFKFLSFPLLFELCKTRLDTKDYL